MQVCARPMRGPGGRSPGVANKLRRVASRRALSCFNVAEQSPSHHNLRLHYWRPDAMYSGWGLHVWGSVATETAWAEPLAPNQGPDGNCFWDVALREDSSSSAQVNFIVHKGETVDAKGAVQLADGGAEAWVVSGVGGIWRSQPDLRTLPRGDLGRACAYWLDADVLATPLEPAGLEFFLHASATARLTLGAGGVAGADAPPLRLRVDPAGFPAAVVAKFPHLANLTCLRLPADASRLHLLKCQLAVAAVGEDGAPVDATGVQNAGALDALCTYAGPLGATRDGPNVALHLWAPTALRVELLLFRGPREDGDAQCLEMQEGKCGVWAARLPAAYEGRYYYRYRVTAFHPSTGRIETCEATDPYSRALAANGTRTQLMCGLESPELMPAGWSTLASRKPALAHHNDAVLYELHVRDFSVTDATVPVDVRGTFGAFAQQSLGTRHLASLAEAGVTHVHLLPVYDFGSVDERRENWKEPTGPGGAPLASFASDSEVQQAAVMAVAGEDAYNWGYDPVHWGVPDGSYCKQPDGAGRTLEFRAAVSALNALGLRVVLDVVYNHVYGSGPASQHAVLDKLVPGYYLRRDAEGDVEASTCMNNTASEHAMCERLIVDDVVHWATTYKVDGFRFDLMGHLMKRVMLSIRNALDALHPGADGSGVDGRSILIYGEGWDYAEVADGRVGENGSQHMLAGTGLGTFNDRIREGAMGGGPFGDPRLQGLLTGLWSSPAPDVSQGTAAEQRVALARATERVLTGVAANLSHYEFLGSGGAMIAGRDAGGVGSRCGYAMTPQETVNYCSAHDNETLFDLVTLKMYRVSTLADRCRVVSLAQALLAWSQGIPFFHAGDEVLRSKSLDRDSYNSGDWFNALDFSGARTGWGVGLPPAGKNAAHWPLQRELLADPACAPSPADVAAAAARFRRALRVRASSPLFRLRTAAEVQERLRMHNRGADEVPGVLVWELCDDAASTRLDANFARLMVGLNATQSAATLRLPTGHVWQLHPTLAESEDDAVRAASLSADGMLSLPPLTAAVFVVRRS